MGQVVGARTRSRARGSTDDTMIKKKDGVAHIVISPGNKN